MRLTEVRDDVRRILDEALFHLVRSPGEREQIVSYVLHSRVDLIGTKLHEVIERGLDTPPAGRGPRTIYLVSSGAWSYKTVHCAFPTRELAWGYVEAIKLARLIAAAANDEDQWRSDPYIEELTMFDAVPRTGVTIDTSGANPWAITDYGLEWQGNEE